MRRFVVFGLFIFCFLPAAAQAHRSGCHRWHTCPSDTGSYQMDYWPSGDVMQYCGSKMYMGADGHCHYYTTPGTFGSSYTTRGYAPVYEDPCTVTNLVRKYQEVKATGEEMTDLSSKAWWSGCPSSNRQGAYAKISALYENETQDQCVASLGEHALFSEVTQQCECSTGYSKKDGSCQPKPECSNQERFVLKSGTCECTYQFERNRAGKCVRKK